MAHREKAPYAAQDVHEVRMMVQGLEAHQKKGRGKGGFSVKKSTFHLPTGRTVDSWRMQDWDYKKPNLITYARGLFTCKNSKGDPQIVVRGYDKFFNTGEVRKTEWRNVEKNTRGPYELSVKENGCIIFMAGMDDDTLLVCSKHSTGERSDIDVSHAAAGERWVEKHLAQVGKTKEDLARKLREMNATAVAELCDDDFEEHVLAYTPEAAGLYLHGINLNLPTFATYPGHLVDQFADEWGFKKTMYVMEDDIHQVKEFLDKVAETGSYAGRETEGFVIRCQARETADSPWEDWFFKYKFEEPYLMYRQWRECTKAVIAGKSPKIKKHKKITEDYLLYARRRFVKEPHLTKLYNQNHGIIALRNDFLADRGVNGADIIRQEIENGEVASGDVTSNVVLVPIATIGCGKTTVALALVKLFQWGHVQNDNIQGKQRRMERFAQAICTALGQEQVVIADKNNHQKRERQQIFDEVGKIIPNAHYVALHWVHDRSNYNEIRRVMQERVLSRGDNHQTIQANAKGSGAVIEIMEGFLYRFQPLDMSESPDDAFDFTIDLDVTASSRDNLETIVTKLHQEYPKLFRDMPTADDLDNAIEAALNDYKPDIKHDLGFRGGNKNKGGKDRQTQVQMQRQLERAQSRDQNGAEYGSVPEPVPAKKQPKLEFFAVRLPASRVNSIVEACFSDKDAATARLFRQLQQTRRVQSEFHVTLIHKASAAQHQELWDRLAAIHERAFDDAMKKDPPKSGYPEPELGTCNVMLERVVWDNRLMCVVARLLNEDQGEQWQSVNKVPHVTIGTASSNIKPKESNDLLQKWLSHEGDGDAGFSELVIPGHVVLDGSVRGVLSKF
ncbi:tRNA ligase-like protein [Rhizodiscina lignyota]|uniref:tRNA ligase n=1 Tax=Rhizodiscina lignyota TaxID=1504668 RepID=A0A9P4M174_9PEZI|nr:tRNA ligase-like protein [Rhizodiscina lignyota]